jgi:hypothetical protein
MDKKIQTLMENLGITESEALEVLDCDKRIDKGEKLFELSQEQEKASKKARSVARTPTVYNFSKRERKSDNDKGELIDLIVDCLTPKVDNLVVVNAERELTFNFNGRKFKIVLSAPRS